MLAKIDRFIACWMFKSRRLRRESLTSLILLCKAKIYYLFFGALKDSFSLLEKRFMDIIRIAYSDR